MKRIWNLTAAVALAVPSLVCAQQPAPAPKPAAPAGPSEVAARVGDRVITVAEVDEAWRAADAAAQAQAVQAIYDGRRQALDRLVADLLIEQAAKAKGMSAEQFVRDETQRRVKPLADAEIAAFYEQNKGRMQGKPLDEMRGPIRSFLEQQRASNVRDAIVAELRMGGPPISVALEPPRQAIETVASDPSRGPANAPVVLVEFSDYQ
ncbi:MAG: SurA N-terminal domain-containing protein [Steroidobacteraceae bacterium]